MEHYQEHHSTIAQTIAAFNKQVDTFKRLYIMEPSAVNNRRITYKGYEKNDKFTVIQFLDISFHRQNQDCSTTPFFFDGE